MMYFVHADVVINNTLAVRADSEGEAKAKAAAMLCSVMDLEPMYPDDIILLDTDVQAIEDIDCEESEEDFDDFLYGEDDDDDYDPPEYFND